MTDMIEAGYDEKDLRPEVDVDSPKKGKKVVVKGEK
jgi:hypothetical protein